VEFTFPSTQVGCLRILATEESQDDYGSRYFQLAEISLYANSLLLTEAELVFPPVQAEPTTNHPHMVAPGLESEDAAGPE
jgi:hypothetical protein